MYQKGWTRVQGLNSEPPTGPHFRGPEGDDEFTTASPDELMQRALTGPQGAGHVGRDPRCQQPRNARAPGTVCP
jgi:hypothetical protein